MPVRLSQGAPAERELGRLSTCGPGSRAGQP